MSHTVVEEQGTGTRHVWELPTDEQTLLSPVKDIFERHWEHIWFGVIIHASEDPAIRSLRSTPVRSRRWACPRLSRGPAGGQEE